MSFAFLPHELQLRIVLHAVQQPHGHASQARTLALVSRQVHAIVRKLLWAHIRIVRPSQLRRIHSALQANQALGNLVQSIHLGADENLRLQGWPLQHHRDGEGIELKVITTLPESLLPRWVEPGSGFDTERGEEHDCKHFAVYDTIYRASEAFDVYPRVRGQSHEHFSDRTIGTRAWAARLWEVQAALDLHLAEMRRWEDLRGYPIKPHGTEAYWIWRDLDRKCEEASCGHYPVVDLPRRAERTRPPLGDEPDVAGLERLTLTREQLWDYIASQADHFDHLLLFLGSSQEGLDLDDIGWEQLNDDLGGPPWRQMLFGEPDHVETASAKESSTAVDWCDGGLATPCHARIDKAEDLLQIARSVLGLTQGVTNLSLTGFLHRAVDGLRSPEALRRLSIGPVARWWEHILVTSASALEDDSVGQAEAGGSQSHATLRLAHLRICGRPSSRDAAHVATQLPSLQSMLWQRRDTGFADEALEVVQHLQGQLDQSSAATPQPSSGRYTKVRLQPEDVPELLVRAPSSEVREAWLAGLPVQGTLHTIKVVASNHRLRPSPWWPEDEYEQRTAAQYEEGKEWWEAGRVGLGLHSQATEGG